jgi:hypothetical protein
MEEFDPDLPEVESKWRDKYKTLKEYYTKEYNSKYYEFTKLEMEIDPDETVDDFEQYSEQRRKEEIVKCALSFEYFATKYLKILHIQHGLLPFILYKYQRRVIKEYDKHRFTIISKFRQGGLTTVTELWLLWRCLFKFDQQIMFLSKTDREAIAAGDILNRAVENLPSWLRPNRADGKWNDHVKQFTETGGNMFFYTPEAARGRSITYLIIDEAAFVQDMEEQWKAIYPTMSTGGRCIVVSTVNGIGNWYHEIFQDALEKKNKFHPIELDYWEHPDYNDPQWVEDTKAQLRDKGWRQEVLRDFLGSGDTYIPAYIIKELENKCKENHPKRKLFEKWANSIDKKTASKDDWERPGALWIWKEPIEGHEYVMGIDCAEGVGDDGDNSSFQVVDAATLEQVGEFYSNIIPPFMFASVVNEVGIYYNNALVVCESNGPGGAVLSNLQHELWYENIFFDQTGKLKNPKPGLKTTVSSRPILLEALQHRLMNQTLRVNSRRFVKELGTFIYNPQTQKAEAQKNKHDDTIMAMCVALYVRDSQMRDIPMGAEVPSDLAQPFQSVIYEEIRKELLEGAPMDLLDDSTDDPILLPDQEDILPGVVFNFRRRYDKLLKEFGW